ncbi:hypothetical protein D5039_21560 [Verminephrobacter aporrectodeae subsp. tuberculatae]|uniref:Uncharacterized protein n=1 Tax=Verminephrobacter aporrectodeae subsp. tuberculatae TaxID=1110392 RepID=A0ABT3KZ68_9BURK|nr:hypothetical protein [Verminephrobacter aporrectodeae]MCW5323638.1 hypothetical protein [Verminephrobacter aporrectodeae subsp. tuberculatae]
MQTAHIAQAETTTQATNYPKLVVVENAGTDTEGVWSDHRTFMAALKEMENCGGADSGFDVMKRLPDDTLTTEF